MYSKEVLKETENTIKEYYKKLKKLAFYNTRVESLNNMYTNKFHLHSDISSLNYNSPKVQGGPLPSSPMDKEIENIKDAQIEKIECELKESQKIIINLTYETALIKDIIKNLSKENQKLLDLIYNQKRSYESLAFDLNEAKASICRKNKLILNEITDYIQWVERVKSV